MTQTQMKAVVFAGDYAYIRQIETAIKSLCYHNSHLKIYIFNQDIPPEWFRAVRGHVETLGGELVDVKLLGPDFAMNWSNKLPHINHMTFARYFIPDFVAEDKVLYLDSDLIVTGDITGLFEMDLTGYYAAAAPSCFGLGLGFNAGVLLINNALWKADKLRQTLVETTEREHANVNEGDQSILNMVFAGRYLPLEETYNFQIGFDRGAAEQGHQFILDMPLEPLPKILHYISPDKPWNTYSIGRLREIWWDYHLMEWTTILANWKARGLAEPIKTLPTQFTVMTLTNSYLLEQIDYLVQALPRVRFIIAAYTLMAPELMRLSAYPNVTLYPNSFPLLLTELVKQTDLYLDVNHFGKWPEIYEEVKRAQLPMLAFDNTAEDGQSYQDLVPHGQPEEMVVAIRGLMAEKGDRHA